MKSPLGYATWLACCFSYSTAQAVTNSWVNPSVTKSIYPLSPTPCINHPSMWSFSFLPRTDCSFLWGPPSQLLNQAEWSLLSEAGHSLPHHAELFISAAPATLGSCGTGKRSQAPCMATQMTHSLHCGVQLRKIILQAALLHTSRPSYGHWEMLACNYKCCTRDLTGHDSAVSLKGYCESLNLGTKITNMPVKFSEC